MSEHIDQLDWGAVRVAFQVARLGTLSSAASYLGVHHATVGRQVEALEAQLATRLFQRHARGYTPTKAGLELLEIGSEMDARLGQFAQKLHGEKNLVQGDLTVTSLDAISPWLVPILARFQQAHPDVNSRLLLDERLLKLEHGEAHVAVRVGPRPDGPDDVVQHAVRAQMTLFAHRDYVARLGMLESLDRLGEHRFIAHAAGNMGSPQHRWVAENVPDEAVVFRASEDMALTAAMKAGMGIWFWPLHDEDPDLVQMCEPLPEWSIDFWLVRHRDLARSNSVQALSSFLLDELRARIQ